MERLKDKEKNMKELSPKERVLKAINFEEPDRVPIFITITPQVAERLSQFLGIPEYQWTTNLVLQ